MRNNLSKLCWLASTLQADNEEGQFLSIDLNGEAWRLHYQPYHAHLPTSAAVCFLLFLPGHRFARKAITVWNDGRYRDDAELSVPDYDRAANEPVLQEPTEDLLETIYDRLLIESTARTPRRLVALPMAASAMERAARRLCILRGLDPDSPVDLHPGVRAIGTATMRWQAMEAEIRRTLEVHACVMQVLDEESGVMSR